MITIVNNGQLILDSNYWDSQMAKRGLLYLSWNAGAARLLVPDAMKTAIKEMKTAKYVIISKGKLAKSGGKEALELLFEDMSDSPYVINISIDQADRMLPKSEHGSEFALSVWTRMGMHFTINGKYRVVDRVPCLKEWIPVRRK